MTIEALLVNEAGREQARSTASRSVIVVGGGRWGAVWCNELLRRPDPIAVHWISRRNAAGVRDLAAQLNTSSSECRVSVWTDLARCIAGAAPAAAIVANLPSQHVATATELLAAGVPTLVEKPVTLDRAELTALVRVAADADASLLTGLEYLVAPSIVAFAQAVRSLGLPERVAVKWQDAAGTRTTNPQRKRFDHTTNVVADVYPHVLSILRVVVGDGSITLEHCALSDGGWSAELALSCGNVPIAASLTRDANAPRRVLSLSIPDVGIVELDFTSEPARAWLGGKHLDLGRWGASSATSLGVELDCLLDSDGPVTSPLSIENTQPLHEAVLDGVEHARVQQASRMRASVRGDSRPTDHRAIAEEILPTLLDLGAVKPDDDGAITRWCVAALRAVRVLAHDAFAYQEHVAQACGMGAGELRALNTALRDSRLVQSLITEGGSAAKYWLNTVLPLRATGAVDDVVAERTRYPFRVGVYVGVSCMFHCTFCGRNPEARYDRPIVGPGNEMFRHMLETAPADDPHRFYISGGLEPLTNPELGDLVTLGASRGFRLSLYTNGLLLTETTLRRQPGLWDLDSIRISLYGPDEESFLAVTRKPNAFDRVIANAYEFVRLRGERQSSVRFGFNYVVLPGQAEKLIDVLSLIASINERAYETGVAPVDFLTVREDYSTANGGFDGREREELRRLLDTADQRLREPALESLAVDYGYGLDALRRGYPSSPLAFVDDDDVLACGYPQISLVVDLLGDVYLYREAGFLDRPGADRYIIGRVTPEHNLYDVVTRFIESGARCEVERGDTQFFDAFDHVATQLVQQTARDAAFGVPSWAGPIAGEASDEQKTLVLAHPTLPC